MTSRAVLIPAMFVLAAGLCSAQVASQSIMSTGAGSFSASASFGAPPPFAMTPVTGAPYSAEEVSETVQTLSDGTRITHKMPGRRIWRDSEGRMRTERPFGPTTAQPSLPMIVQITDPVAGYQYVLDTQNKVAHRQALPAPGSRPAGFTGGPGASATGALVVRQAPAALPASGGSGGSANFGVITSAIPAPAGAPARPNFSRESLGTQSVDGVLAEGTRTTTTYPAGMVGNDREFSATSESWMSPDLKVMVLSKNNDPRQGESTFRLENLSRTPPDPALFMVPADYTVTDETGPFTIHFTNR